MEATHKGFLRDASRIATAMQRLNSAPTEDQAREVVRLCADVLKRSPDMPAELREAIDSCATKARIYLLDRYLIEHARETGN